MAKILNEVDAFSADITVPEDGDPRNAASVEVAFQALANRTRYLNNRLAYASYGVQGNNVDNGGKFTLTEETNSGGFVLDNNEITVPAVGVYLIEASGVFTSSTDTNPLVFGMVVLHGSDDVVTCASTRFSGNGAHLIHASGVGVVDVTDPSDKISVVSFVSGVSCVGSLNKLVIRRLS
jgi:hypothetical protein